MRTERAAWPSTLASALANPVSDAPQNAGAATPGIDIARLIRAVRRGDEKSFEEFYERYCDRLYRLLLGWTRGDEHTAREVLQSVMIRVATRLPMIQSERELWSWLARVARNAFVDHVRRASRASRPASVGIEHASGVAGEEPHEDAALEWLDSALESLPPEEGWLVREFYYQRRSCQELAGTTGKTPKAIESKLARIRVTLRSIINKKAQHEETGL